MRHTKPPSATVLMEGWMVHYTNKSNLVSLQLLLSINFITFVFSSERNITGDLIQKLLHSIKHKTVHIIIKRSNWPTF